MKTIKVLSLFSGIGAFEKALANIGINQDLVGFSEIDKYAIKSYCAIHNVDEKLNLGDITKIEINTLPRFIDLITHGSPCQDFSIAGKQEGAEKGSGTRSSLMWNTVDIVEWCLPKYVIWENVKNLLSKKHKHNFDSYIEIMDKLGYNSYYQILNAKDYGVPQNRERVYTVSIRKDIDNNNFKFPDKEELKIRLKNILEESVEEKYYLSKKMIDGFMEHNRKHKEKGTGFIWKPKTKEDIATTLRANGALCPTDNTINEEISPTITAGTIMQVGKLDIKGQDNIKRVYDTEGISPTLTDMQGGNRQPKILDKTICLNSKDGRNGIEGLQPSIKDRIYDSEGIATCVATSNFFMPNYVNNLRIRKLTPLECWRLMRFF